MGPGPFGVGLFIARFDAFHHFPHFNGFEAYCSRTAALKSTAQQAAATFRRDVSALARRLKQVGLTILLIMSILSKNIPMRTIRQMFAWPEELRTTAKNHIENRRDLGKLLPNRSLD